MPCIFCIAVFAVLAGALTSAVVDQLEARLGTIVEGPVDRLVDSASVAKFELTVPIPKAHGMGTRAIPVNVTVYKKHGRVRIQVMTHDLTRAEAEALEDLIARTLELTIVDRSDAHDEQKVREAFGEDADADAAAVDREAEELRSKTPAKQAEAPIQPSSRTCQCVGWPGLEGWSKKPMPFTAVGVTGPE